LDIRLLHLQVEGFRHNICGELGRKDSVQLIVGRPSVYITEMCQHPKTEEGKLVMDPQASLDHWSRITMLIENDWGERGTGFLIRAAINHGSLSTVKFFLVTCKHVLNKKAELRMQAQEITVYPLVSQVDGSKLRERRTIALYKHGSRIWREHPDPKVDVMLFDVTDLICGDTRIEHDAPDTRAFASPQWMRDLAISTNDQVVFIGFPDMERPETSNPVFRSGTISTPLNRNMEFQGETQVYSLRAFAIDGETIPGSSGSPVVLKPTIGRIIGGRNYLNRSVPPLLLGVLAEATYAEVEYGKFKGWTYSGMGIVFHADTIADIIALYVG